MNDIFKEVEEEYRQEQLLRFWHANALQIIAILVLCLIGAGGASYWQSHRLQKKQDETYVFAQAALTAAGQGPEAARDAFAKVIPGLSGGRLIAAKLAHAGASDMAGDPAGAIREYDEVAADKTATSAEQKLAEMSSIALQLSTGDPATLSARLEKLSGDEEAWRYTAREFLALLALKQGDKKKAFDLAAPLARDKAAPDGVHTMAAQLAAISAEGRPMAATETAPDEISISQPDSAPEQK